MLAQKGEVLPGEFQRRVIDVGAEDAGDSVSMQECESGEEVAAAAAWIPYLGGGVRGERQCSLEHLAGEACGEGGEPGGRVEHAAGEVGVTLSRDGVAVGHSRAYARPRWRAAS